MCSRSCLLLLCALVARAQYSALTVTDDGSRVYFTTTLVERSRTEPSRPELRLFGFDSSRLTLAAERGARAPLGMSVGGEGVEAPQILGDGKTLAYTLVNVCPEGGECAQPLQRMAFIDGQAVGERSVHLSRNGRYAILGSTTDESTIMVDRQTGERRELPEVRAENFPVASDGTVVVRAQAGTALWKGGQITPLRISGPHRIFGISSNAEVVVASRFDVSDPSQLREELIAMSVRTGEVNMLHGGAPAYLRLYGVSNDGARVLWGFGESGDTWVSNTRTGERWQAPLGRSERPTAGALSGDGRFAFLATNRGRIVRFTVGGTVEDDIIPPTPYLALPFALAPGSFKELEGPPDFDSDSLRERIRIGDRALFVLYASSGKIGTQTPWDLNGEQALRFDIPNQSPLQQHELVWVYPHAEPVWDRVAGGYMGLKLVRGDFSGMQTTLPQPGDIVHLYATGLGPVEGFSEVGVPTPSDRLFPIQGDFRCRFHSYDDYAETLFAGLAPGMIGIYQVTMRMPATQNTPRLGTMSFECTGDYGSFGITSTKVLAN